MKAPDKVFFPNDINLLTKLSLVIKQKGDICYIRKDAMLEWAREKKERLGKMFDAMPATAIGAKLDACKEFIDKIESL